MGVFFKRASSGFWFWGFFGGRELWGFCLVLVLFGGIEETEVRTLKVLGR